jgi:hypothetical protein
MAAYIVNQTYDGSTRTFPTLSQAVSQHLSNESIFQ